MVQNLKFAERSVFIFLKLLVQHSLGENVRMKEKAIKCVRIYSVR